MTVKLTKELAAALHATGESELEVVDPETRDAIAQGIAEMEAGEGIPIEKARRLTRERLLARKQ
jgi:hypothetical protein